MKLPFPYFGGKTKAASIIWQRLGDVSNYVEPFFGGGAVLFNRPHTPRIETVNDIDCYLANFWRCVQIDPQGTAEHADWPVNECDLHARHRWLIDEKEAFSEKLKHDPDYYDTRIAGWWVWGICQWIGKGWCKAVSHALPHLGNLGMGVHRPKTNLHVYFNEIADRLRGVRVCCGDWKRVVGPTPTYKVGLTGILLDPPYGDVGRIKEVYTHEDLDVSADVRAWAIENGDNPLLRIALCGYDDEHRMPDSWECVAWKTNGGYANQGKVTSGNKHRERIWFSPHCLKIDKQVSLFPQD